MNRPSSRVRNGLAAFGALAAISGAVVGLPTAAADPTTTDDRGFVDSTARCAAPNTAILFGATSRSRIAICKDDASGQYQYRGVRVSDGARLILPAKPVDGGFVAENQGNTYTVTSKALVVSDGQTQIRSEPMVDFHGQGAASAPAAPATTQPSAAPETVTPTTPLPPPLPAEVGGG